MQKSNSVTGIIGLIILLFIWWAFASDAKEKREAIIISSVEKICEQQFKNFDCLGMGFDVASEYERQAKDSGDRE
ncbi:MAG: hypothetical protein ACD_19C00187G0011 [uncultured bacterium]|nr:MAG: hypothetical protein ACD_19C00187G0011 [uncultured bacterium]